MEFPGLLAFDNSPAGPEREHALLLEPLPGGAHLRQVSPICPDGEPSMGFLGVLVASSAPVSPLIWGSSLLAPIL